jgi:hypothetical protein
MLAGITQGVKEVGIAVDMHGFCAHSLRATATTNAFAHGADIAKVQGRCAFTQAIRFDRLLSRGYYNLEGLGEDEGLLRRA